MSSITQIIILIIILEHLFIVYMEMFAWETIGKKVFKGALEKDLFKPTKILAANQGLYNGFLVAGLIWSLLISNDIWAKNVALFFLGCILVAGIFGTFSASKKIFFVQVIPSILGLLAVLFL